MRKSVFRNEKIEIFTVYYTLHDNIYDENNATIFTRNLTYQRIGGYR